MPAHEQGLTMSGADRRDWSAIRNFKPAEFRQDPGLVDWRLVLAMDRLRDDARMRVHIHEAQSQAGHAPASYHRATSTRLAQAVDFHFSADPRLDVHLNYLAQFALIASRLDFGGIGFYPHWRPVPGWHVDLRAWPDGARLYWYRDQAGTYHYGPQAIARAVREAQEAREGV